MSAFALPESTPSGFQQVGSPDALVGQSGMVGGLERAAEAWDAAASTLEAVASALGTDTSALRASWEGTAATQTLKQMQQAIASANSGAQSFRQYADNLRAIAAYVRKIRQLKAAMHNIWKLILIDIFVGLAALVVGFVGAELLGPVFSALSSVLGRLLTTVAGLVRPVAAEVGPGIEELPTI
jgi:uncharacterized protein YukE